MAKLDTIKQKVIKKLMEEPDTRNSDTLLYFTLLRDTYKEMQEGERNVPYGFEDDFLRDLWALIKKAPDKSTVVRIRRYIQHDELLFLPTQRDVIEKRVKNQSDLLRWLKEQ